MKRILAISVLSFLTSQTWAQTIPKSKDSLRWYIQDESRPDSLIRHAYVQLMQHYIYRSRTDSALYYSDQLIDYSERFNYGIGFITAYYNRGFHHFRRGNYHEAINNLNIAFDYAIKVDDKHRQLDIFSRIATIYEIRNKPDSALIYLNQMIDISSENNNVRFLAAAYVGKGRIKSHSQIDSALIYYLKADSLYKQPYLDLPYQEGVNQHNIALVYYQEMKDLNKTSEYIDLAQNNYVKYGKGQESSKSLNILRARLASAQNDLDQSDSLIQKSIEYYRENSNKRKLAEALNVYANNSIEQREYKKAIITLSETLIINTQLENELELGSTHNLLAEAHSSLGNYDQSIYHHQQTIEISPNISVKSKSLKALSVVYYQSRQYQSAYNALKSYQAIVDSTNREETQTKFQELETKYQTSQKEQEIVQLQLNQANTESRNQRNIIWGLMTLALAGLVALYFFFTGREKTKKNQYLQSIDEFRSRLFANVSHEFRTPLTLIKGPTEMIAKDHYINGKYSSEIKIINRSTQRLEKLINSINDLTMLESDRLELSVIKMPDLEQLKIIVASFASLADVQQIDYQIDISNAKHPIWYDPYIVETICYNLISNALKYAPESEVWFKANVIDNHLVIEVSDTGPGIPFEDRAKIFDRYYKSDDDPKSAGGIGLGLALSKQYAQLHKGDLILKDDDLSMGAHFEFRVPCTESSFIVSEKSKNKLHDFKHIESRSWIPQLVSPPEKALDIIDSKILLIVEDNFDMISFLTRLFETEYQVITAQNGELGLAKAIDHMPDLIISDLMMPVMDGKEFLKKVKREERTNHIPFIMLTANHLEGEKLKAIKFGVDDFIQKPFSGKELTLKVDNLIAIREQLKSKYQGQSIVTINAESKDDVEKVFLRKVQLIVEQHLDDSEFSAKRFSQTMNMSRMQLHRKLKAITGLSTSNFLRTERLYVAQKLLKEPHESITQVAYAVGFTSTDYFSSSFKETFGMTPTEYVNKTNINRKKGKQEE